MSNETLNNNANNNVGNMGGGVPPNMLPPNFNGYYTPPPNNNGFYYYPQMPYLSYMQMPEKKKGVKYYLLVATLTFFVLGVGYVLGVADKNKYENCGAACSANANNTSNLITPNSLQNNLMTDNSQQLNDNLNNALNNNLIDFDAKALAQLKTLPSIKYGNGEPDVYIFTDPNCDACKQLEKDFLQKTKLNYALIPIGALGTDSAVKAAKVNCSKDKKQAWQKILNNDITYFDNNKGFQNKKQLVQCTNETLDNLKFFVKYKFDPLMNNPATPTLISKTGKIEVGVPTTTTLEQWIK